MPPTHRTYPNPTSHPATGRPPIALMALGNRIRLLQRSEPNVEGHTRTQTMQHLTELELRLERLALSAQRTGSDHRQIQANVFALAEEIDQLAQCWPRDVMSRIPATSAAPDNIAAGADRRVA